MRSRLPKGLQPWSRELVGVSEELNETLAPWLGRLDRALGSGSLRSVSSAGEVDGYDGIDRFGDLDRLMVSDWLLLQDYPDEFLRRYTDKELSYYQYAMRQPTDSMQMIALFDAGPDQIGLPRLAHIALFVVIARRAMSKGCHFLWGVLQDPDLILREDIGYDAIVRLLKSRSARVVDEPTRQRWLDTLPTDDDIWYISADDQRSLKTRQLKAIQVTQGAVEESLVVQVSSQTLTLVCPPPKVCISVLQNPYRGNRREAISAEAITLRFSMSGRRLFSIGSDGVEVHSLSTRNQRKKPLVMRCGDDEVMLGLQCTRRRAFLLTATPGELRLHGKEQYPRYNLPVAWQQTGSPMLDCWMTRKVLYFVDGNRVLWRLSYIKRGERPEQMLSDVIVTSMIDGIVRCWVAGDGTLSEYRIYQADELPVEYQKTTLPESVDASAFYHGGVTLHASGLRLGRCDIGFFHEGGVYYKSDGVGFDHTPLPPSPAFSAVIRLPDGLWALGFDQNRQLFGFNPRTLDQKVFVTAWLPITGICAAAALPRVACQTGANSGFVVDLITGEILTKFGDA